jgi:hypothetical protein
VDVPDELKRSLKGEDGTPAEEKKDGEYRGDMISEVLSSQKSNFEEIEQSDLMNQVLQMYADIKFSPLTNELRVKNATYTVTNYLQAYEMSDALKNKARYDTVATASFIARFVRRLKFYAKNREWRKKVDTRVLLDNVNLRFRSGKMYLILGGKLMLLRYKCMHGLFAFIVSQWILPLTAPGAGKSTLLKYIADSLREDNDHVREGSVSLNGIPSDDPSTYWTVSINALLFVFKWPALLISFSLESCCVYRPNRSASSIPDGAGNLELRLAV